MTHKRLVFPFLGILLVLMLTPLWIMAQDQPPAPQFLYINENHLILLNGYTGQTTILPINITAGDHFTWSPNGKYIVANLASENTSYFCLNLYDVDQQKWIQDKPISCEVHDFIFTNDGSALYYAFDNETNGILQKYSVKDKTSRELYRTDNGTGASNGVSELKWSTTETYLTFEDYHWIMGGTLNTFIIMNVETEKYSSISAPNTYYADYSPIWSPDEDWFLIILREEYITSFALPMSNHKGDLYLVNAKTGKQYRQTYNCST
jgi:WD40 repeat protein